MVFFKLKVERPNGECLITSKDEYHLSLYVSGALDGGAVVTILNIVENTDFDLTVSNYDCKE